MNSNNDTKQYFDLIDKQSLFSKYPNVSILSSKSSKILIGLIRDKDLDMKGFRTYSTRLIRLLLEEAMASQCVKEIIKESPLGQYKTYEVPKEEDFIGVSILRSGNAMAREYTHLFPNSSIGTILMQRNEKSEKKEPILFYEKFPKDINTKKIILMDPMLATGGSCLAAIDIFINKGVKQEDITFVNVISAVEGIDAIYKKYPNIKMITAKVDPVLLPNKYIAPGLGDFGDRFFGTIE